MRFPTLPAITAAALTMLVATAVPSIGPATASLTTAGNKPDVTGFVAQFGAAGETRTAVNYFIVNVSWAQLQPDGAVLTKNGHRLSGRDMNRAAIPEIAAGNPIDQAITAVAKSHGRWGGIKVRLFTGAKSPGWVLADYGAVSLHGFNHHGTIRVPRFWNWAAPNGGAETYPFRDAYGRLQRSLAASYDGTTGAAASVREVTVAGCMTEFAEPMVRNRADGAVMHAAGYSTAKDLLCQRGSIDVAAAAWRHTTLSLAVNPYVDLDAHNKSVTIAEGIAQHCRAVLGTRCLLQNNELCRDAPGNSGSQLIRLYNWMASLNSPKAPAATRGPIAFQTGAPTGGAGSWDAVYSPPSGASFQHCVRDAGRWAPRSLEIRTPSPPENPAITSNAELVTLEGSSIHAGNAG